MDYLKKIEAMVEASYVGVLPDYYRVLGLKLCKALINWIPEEHLHDVLDDIRYARHVVEGMILEDTERERYVDEGKVSLIREIRSKANLREDVLKIFTLEELMYMSKSLDQNPLEGKP